MFWVILFWQTKLFAKWRSLLEKERFKDDLQSALRTPESLFKFFFYFDACKKSQNVTFRN